MVIKPKLITIHYEYVGQQIISVGDTTMDSEEDIFDFSTILIVPFLF